MPRGCEENYYILSLEFSIYTGIYSHMSFVTSFCRPLLHDSDNSHAQSYICETGNMSRALHHLAFLSSDKRSYMHALVRMRAHRITSHRTSPPSSHAWEHVAPVVMRSNYETYNAQRVNFNNSATSADHVHTYIHQTSRVVAI